MGNRKKIIRCSEQENLALGRWARSRAIGLTRGRTSRRPGRRNTYTIPYSRTCIARSVALELPHRAQGRPVGPPCPFSRPRRRMYPPPRPQSTKGNPVRRTSRGPPPLFVLRVDPSPLLRDTPRSARKDLSSSPSSPSIGIPGQTVGCPPEPHLPSHVTVKRIAKLIGAHDVTMIGKMFWR